MRGKLITFEGIDGSGKTTQIKLLAPWLREQGIDVVVTREPGGTKIGEEIRSILHDSGNKGMTRETELLLFSAARSQLLKEVIMPALEAGKIVLCDRYIDSTYAYQGFGRGIAKWNVAKVVNASTYRIRPDLTFLLDVPIEIGAIRKYESGDELTRLDLEALEFRTAVIEGYKDLVEWPVCDRWRVINGTLSIGMVFDSICVSLSDMLGMDG